MAKLETVTIEIPTSAADDILDIMAPQLGEADRGVLLKEFATLGFEHLYQWLSGEERYRSITDQHIAWLQDVYTRLLPETEVPSYARLYGKFNIPYGRAGYLIRVLNETGLPHLRSQARAELRELLGSEYETAQEAINDNRPDVSIGIRMSSLASRELRSILNHLCQVDPTTELPVKSSSYGDVKTVFVPVSTVLRVFDTIADG